MRLHGSLASEADDGGFVDPAEDEEADAAEDPGAPVPLEGEHGGAAPFAGDAAEEGEGAGEECDEGDGEPEGLGEEGGEDVSVGEVGDGGGASAGGAGVAGELVEAAGGHTEEAVFFAEAIGGGGEVEAEAEHSEADGGGEEAPDAGDGFFGEGGAEGGGALRLEGDGGRRRGCLGDVGHSGGIVAKSGVGVAVYQRRWRMGRVRVSFSNELLHGVAQRRG